MPARQMRPRATPLDVDGPLVDSNDQHAHARVDAFREAGHDVPGERVRPPIGMGGDTPYDVQAARAAGVGCVPRRHPGRERRPGRRAGAVRRVAVRHHQRHHGPGGEARRVRVSAAAPLAAAR